MNKKGRLSKLIAKLPMFTLVQIDGVPSGKRGLKKVDLIYWRNNENGGKNKTFADYVRGVNIERTKANNQHLQLPRENRRQILNERGFM